MAKPQCTCNFSSSLGQAKAFFCSVQMFKAFDLLVKFSLPSLLESPGISSLQVVLLLLVKYARRTSQVIDFFVLFLLVVFRV